MTFASGDQAGMAEPFDVQRWLADHTPPGFTAVVRPRPLGCWTKLSSTKASGDAAYDYGSLGGLATYQPPSLNQHLGQGYPDLYIRKDDGEATPVEVVIRGVQQCGANPHAISICTFRNNLNKICNTLLSAGDDWAIDACFHNGTMYLDIVKTPQAQFPDSDLFTYYGYKFEQLCTGGASANDGVVDSSSEFALLVQLRLGSHDIVMAAEVDCARDVGPLSALPYDTSCFLELKTAKLHPNPKVRERNLAQKFRKWWVQSFLAAVPTIVVGGRDDAGKLIQVFELPVATLPSAAAAAGQGFDAWQVLQFGDEVLSWMSMACQYSADQQLRFEYSPSERRIHCRVVPGGTLPARLARELG